MDLTEIKSKIKARNNSNRVGITLQVITVQAMVDEIERQGTFLYVLSKDAMAMAWARDTLQMMVKDRIVEYIDLGLLNETIAANEELLAQFEYSSVDDARDVAEENARLRGLLNERDFHENWDASRAHAAELIQRELQNRIDDLEAHVGELAGALEEADVLLDTLAIYNVKAWLDTLPPQYATDWAQAHDRVQDALDQTRQASQ
jgi:hypothetical protein